MISFQIQTLYFNISNSLEVVLKYSFFACKGQKERKKFSSLKKLKLNKQHISKCKIVMCSLKLNFETSVLSIVTYDNSIADDQYFTKYVNIPSNKFCVMRVNGIDISDNDFTLVSNTDFYEIVNKYIKEFNLTPEEIKVSNNKFNLEDLIVDETNYNFGPDLCSFTLYSISLYN
jgi:hypothetical protein